MQLVPDTAQLLGPSDRCSKAAVVMLAIQKYTDIAGFLGDTLHSLVDRCKAAGKMYCSYETSVYYLFTKLHARTHAHTHSGANIRCCLNPQFHPPVSNGSTQHDNSRLSGHSPNTPESTAPWTHLYRPSPVSTLTLLPPVPF